MSLVAHRFARVKFDICFDFFQQHLPEENNNKYSGSFLWQQLMIANYRVKKFIRKSQ